MEPICGDVLEICRNKRNECFVARGWIRIADRQEVHGIYYHRFFVED